MDKGKEENGCPGPTRGKISDHTQTSLMIC